MRVYKSNTINPGSAQVCSMSLSIPGDGPAPGAALTGSGWLRKVPASHGGGGEQERRKRKMKQTNKNTARNRHGTDFLFLVVSHTRRPRSLAENWGEDEETRTSFS